jgi:hypothetical protein
MPLRAIPFQNICPCPVAELYQRTATGKIAQPMRIEGLWESRSRRTCLAGDAILVLTPRGNVYRRRMNQVAFSLKDAV